MNDKKPVSIVVVGDNYAKKIYHLLLFVYFLCSMAVFYSLVFEFAAQAGGLLAKFIVAIVLSALWPALAITHGLGFSILP